MSYNLPPFKVFDVNEDPMSLGPKWESWIDEFQNLMLALGVEDKKRMKALLLYYAGRDVHDIYKTLTDVPTEEYEAAKTKLTNYFTPKVNQTYEIYHFRKMSQNEESASKNGDVETIDEFVTRLKKAAKRCTFADEKLEIKLQVVFGCISKRVRRKALCEDMTLDELLKFARSIELSEKQANFIADL